jgi:hypothetical protein
MSGTAGTESQAESRVKAVRFTEQQGGGNPLGIISKWRCMILGRATALAAQHPGGQT